jgi:hypothetical protein
VLTHINKNRNNPSSVSHLINCSLKLAASRKLTGIHLHHIHALISLRSGANVIKFLRLQVTTFCNNLEHLSLASLSRLGAYLRLEHLKGALLG